MVAVLDMNMIGLSVAARRLGRLTGDRSVGDCE